MVRRVRSLLLVAGVLVALVLPACATGTAPPAGPPVPEAGSAPRRLPEPLPPPAEPATAPPVSVPPAGRVVPVGSAPEGIAADARTRTVALGVREPAQLVLLDADTGQVRTRVPLPGVLRHLQLAEGGGPVLVPVESADSLLRVGLPDGRVLGQVRTGRGPHDANQAANGTVFVANEAGGTVVAIRDDQVVHTFDDVTQPAGLAHVGTVEGLVDVRENTLTLYDAAALRPLTELPAGAGPTHMLADKHGRMIVSDTRGGAILVYTPAPEARQVARVPLPGQPYGITYDPNRDRLWVTVTAANQVVGFDLSDVEPRETARIPTVRQANTVAVDPTTGTLFVTGTADGVVQIVNNP